MRMLCAGHGLGAGRAPCGGWGREHGPPALLAAAEHRAFHSGHGNGLIWRQATTTIPAARNLAADAWALWLSSRYLEIARTVPEPVLALIFIWTAAALGKLYPEADEKTDMQPLDGNKAAGGSWFDIICYGVAQQVLPNILRYTLLRFGINVRASSIIGYVGAGG